LNALVVLLYPEGKENHFEVDNGHEIVSLEGKLKETQGDSQQ